MDDFPPAGGPAKSLQAKLEALNKTQTIQTDIKPKPKVEEPANSVMDEMSINSDDLNEQTDTEPKAKKRLPRLHINWPPTRKTVLISLAVLTVLGGLAAYLLTQLGGHKPIVAAVKPTVTLPKKPLLVASNLSGLPVDPTLNLKPVTAVMVENSTFARPQAGLSQAEVIFEALAEGGVSRFMALYQDTAPDNVGPIRSVRPYFEQWALGFDASIAHVGGSPDALSDISAWDVKNLDEFSNSGSYHRVDSRAAPHNVYTSIADLNQLEASKGYGPSHYTGFARKPDAPAKTPTARSINLGLSGPIYDAHYDYNAATNSYNRSEDGAPLTDSNTNAQLSPKAVVAMVVPYSLGALDASGAYYSDYAAIGNGPVYIFQDGTVTTGQWSKSAATTQITFTDSNGNPIKLNAGQTWITAVATPSKVSYSP